MLTSKYIDHFLDEVTVWQKRLSTADQVIGIWFEVQRTWSHLESIFIDSEDIRAQLPQDAERFDNIDASFKVTSIFCTRTTLSRLRAILRVKVSVNDNVIVIYEFISQKCRRLKILHFFISDLHLTL